MITVDVVPEDWIIRALSAGERDGVAQGVTGGDGRWVLGLPVTTGSDGPEGLEAPAAGDRTSSGSDARVGVFEEGGPFSWVDRHWLQGRGFKGLAGQTFVLPDPRHRGSTLIMVGLGPTETIDTDVWRRAGAAFAKAVGEVASERQLVSIVLPGRPPGGSQGEVAQAIAEGAILGVYEFREYRRGETATHLDGMSLTVPEVQVKEFANGVMCGMAMGDAVTFARDLVNRPASDLTPSIMADVVRKRLARFDGVTVEVWDEDRIAAEGLGGLIGVSRGSSEPPRLVRAEWRPPQADASAHVALVGKGITFDSGGLSLKTADGMSNQKTDMSGAAAVLGALDAVAALQLPVRVTALAPMTENMPGGRALKPGDVLTIRNGSTIEVLNTDAEGRLVLADALALAVELEPEAIVDIATLTGAAVIALGSSIGALYANRQDFLDRMQAAAGRSGEPLWPMPLYDDYRDHIDSDIADMKNIGRPRQAGSIVAALLLQRFVGDTPWAHLDVAGPARSAENSGYITRGGTGFGLRTLVELVRSFT